MGLSRPQPVVSFFNCSTPFLSLSMIIWNGALRETIAVLYFVTNDSVHHQHWLDHHWITTGGFMVPGDTGGVEALSAWGYVMPNLLIVP